MTSTAMTSVTTRSCPSYVAIVAVIGKVKEHQLHDVTCSMTEPTIRPRLSHDAMI